MMFKIYICIIVLGTICQTLQVLDNYSSCFDSNHHNNHVYFKQKYYFMHFKCMIIIFIQNGTYIKN